jgi:branched-subunit amino acid transport protein
VVVDERLLAAIVAVWIFHKTRNSLWMIAGGMLALWGIRLLLSFM